MSFWDTSAIVPLLKEERSTDALRDVIDQESEVVVWWATEIECASALARVERSGELTTSEAARARDDLRTFAASWRQVEPTERVRDISRRLVGVHPLRAADAFQLAAAIVASEDRRGELGFVCLDERLVGAARREGFRVVAVA